MAKKLTRGIGARITVSPKKASVLWIESDPVFGGSESQIQFPAELSGFFALPSRPSIGTHVMRGVTYAGIPFPMKKMDFHHNDVWRINLPTSNQGLGGYPGTILVFEKIGSADRYRLQIVPLRGPLSRRLRQLAKANGAIGWKRRDDGGKRWFGYF